jgi:hypothetical protein
MPRATAAARAVAVPFDAERLLGTRVRPDPGHGKAALLHDFGGTGATFLIPWSDLPNRFAMAPFDQALHAEVTALAACTPGSIRRALIVVSTPGLATPERVGALRRLLDVEEDRRVELAMSVLGQLLRPLSARLEDLGDLVYGEARDRSGSALRQACARRGISPERFTAIHGELISELMLVGLPSRSGHLAGWLRLLNDDLALLGRRLRWRLQRSTDGGEKLRAILSAVTGTVEHAAAPLAAIDELTRDVWALFARWDELRPRIRGMVEELDWRLDGWSQILQAMTDAACVPAEDRGATLARLAQIVEPPVPTLHP